MSLFNVIKYENSRFDFVWKHPVDDLRLGSQLIVRPGQVAFFCRGGIICDEFNEGTYTIRSNNIPLLNKIINIPFGNESPFQAEVWFINTLSNLDMKWGTPIPILLKDPEYSIVVPVRAFGKYGVHVRKPRVFFEKLIGTLKTFSTDDLYAYFSGILLNSITESISMKVAVDKVSILAVPSIIGSISDSVKEMCSEVFDDFGIELINFAIISINIPQDDSSVLALKRATEKKMQIDVVGKDVYVFDTNMDILKTAAGNPGTGGDLINAAMGLGMGFAIGPRFGNQLNQIGNQLNTGINSPPPAPAAGNEYYMFNNSQHYGPYSIENVKDIITKGLINSDTLMWKPGMANWEKASSLPELVALLTNNVPPPPPQSTERKSGD